MPYIGNQPGTGVRNRFIYTATASQTTFSGADDNGKTLKYSDSDFVDVFLNGVCLVPVTDYTSTSKTSVVLTQAASLNDTLEVIAYDIATIADTVSKADGGTFEGDLGITNASPDITLTNNTTEDTDGGRESTVTFKGLQSGGEESTLAQIQASHDGTSDDQKGDLIFRTNDGSDGASPTEAMRITSTQDVGIGDATPESNANYKALTVSSTSGSGGGQVYVQSSTVSSVFGADNAGSGPKSIVQTVTNHPLVLGTNNTERMRVSDEGLTIVNDGHGLNLNYVGATLPDKAGIFTSSTAHTATAYGDLNIKARSDFGGYYGIGFFTASSNATPALRAKIDSSGRLLVGTSVVHSGTNGTLYIETNAVSSRNLMVLNNSDTGSSNAGVVAIYRNQNFTGGITNTNTSTSFNTSSDYRLKENVETLSGAITRVKTLKPKRFSWIVDEEDNPNVDGFLAHEAQAVVPEAVTGTHNETEAIGNITDGEGNTVETGVVEPDTLDEGHTWTATGTQPVYQGIDQAKLVPLLTAALQEAIAKIETLETKVAALEAG